ncbi:hypothetical protein ERO13_D04G006866v2 [Gossypium hirsutum]|nr:hypothetical protein ERO13_D04G006866v2 [Gossypium hirsutum]
MFILCYKFIPYPWNRFSIITLFHSSYHARSVPLPPIHQDFTPQMCSLSPQNPLIFPPILPCLLPLIYMNTKDYPYSFLTLSLFDKC